MKKARSTITLAAAGNGPPMVAGVVYDVDPSDPYIKQHVKAGTIQLLDRGDAPDEAAEWSVEGEPAASTEAPTGGTKAQ